MITHYVSIGIALIGLVLLAGVYIELVQVCRRMDELYELEELEDDVDCS